MINLHGSYMAKVGIKLVTSGSAVKHTTDCTMDLIFFSLFGFYNPFKNISLKWSKSFIKGGRKPENPEKNHLTIRKQNLAFPRDPSEARTTAVRNLMD